MKKVRLLIFVNSMLLGLLGIQGYAADAITATKETADGVSSSIGKETTTAVKEIKDKAVDSVKTTAKASVKSALVDLNTATKEQLISIKGLGQTYADKIIAARPFKAKSELLSKKILSENLYKQVSKFLVVKQP